MITLFLTSLFLLISYLFIKPYFKTKLQGVSLLKIIIIIVPLSIVFYVVISYFRWYTTPESFDVGVEQLKHRDDVRKAIGTFESFTYFDKYLPKKEDNPAEFKVSLTGSKATIFLSCKIKKMNSGEWKMISIRKDSISKVR